MQPVRLGVIGAGLIWIRQHQRELRQLPEVFTPVAFCDVSAERRAEVARDFPQAAIYEQHETLLTRPDIDAVLVLTPIAFNAPVALAALQAGKHVIMEKPMARSSAEGRGLIDAARQRGRHLCVAEQAAYRPSHQVIRALLAGGEIGDLVLWHCVHHWGGDPDTMQGALRYDTTPWRITPDFPLGAMFDGGIHQIAALSSVFGQPESVAATGRKLREGYGDYHHIATLMRYPGAVTGMLSFATALAPTHHQFRIQGTRGALVVEGKQVVVQAAGQPERIEPLPGSDDRIAMWRDFARVFQTGTAPLYTPGRALADVALLEAVARSIKTGGTVNVELSS